jgi:hypothetical protein
MDKPDQTLSPSYEVGFKKPPTNKRFQKGVSGNPNGRPRGALNWKTVFRNAFEEQVTINENGKRTAVTKIEAAAKQLANKSAGGNLQAIKLLAVLAPMIESDDVHLTPPRKVVVEVVYEPLPDRVRHDCLIPGEVVSSQRQE